MKTGQSGDKTSAVPNAGWNKWPADAPKPAISPFAAEQAKKHQEGIRPL